MDKYFIEAEECLKQNKIKEAEKLYKASLIQFKNVKSALALGRLYQKHFEQLDMGRDEALQEARMAYKMGADKGDKDCRKCLIKALLLPPRDFEEIIKQILLHQHSLCPV